MNFPSGSRSPPSVRRLPVNIDTVTPLNKTWDLAPFSFDINLHLSPRALLQVKRNEPKVTTIRWDDMAGVNKGRYIVTDSFHDYSNYSVY